MKPAPLRGLYGSFVYSGAALYASAPTLRLLAKRCRLPEPGFFPLEAPPADLADDGAVEALEVVLVNLDRAVRIGRTNDVLKIHGGADAMELLAQTMENLADSTDRLGDYIRPHMDISYFPGHRFLDPTSMWLTLLIVEAN